MLEVNTRSELTATNVTRTRALSHVQNS